MKLPFLMEAEGILWNFEESLPLDPILNHMNPVRTLTQYFLKINFNIILPSIPNSSQLTLPFMLSD